MAGTARHARLKQRFPDGSVMLREVGLRDGLQLVSQFPTTAQKQQWLEREYAAGVRSFEVGSFLPAARFPQFADVREVIAHARTLPGLYMAALTLNERGVADAMAESVDEMVFVISASESHSQANTRRSRQDAIAMLQRICEQVRTAESGGDNAPFVSAGIAMAFGCSLEGDVAPDEVLRMVDASVEAGADIIALADTVGYAGPKQVGELIAAVRRRIGDIPLGVHLHDTRGMAIANAAAALDNGATLLDGALGGLGGCPFAPGATGNVVFEDLAFLCESMGYETGIDIDGLVKVREVLSEAMPQEALYGGLARSGLPKSESWKAHSRASTVPLV